MYSCYWVLSVRQSAAESVSSSSIGGRHCRWCQCLGGDLISDQSALRIRIRLKSLIRNCMWTQTSGPKSKGKGVYRFFSFLTFPPGFHCAIDVNRLHHPDHPEYISLALIIARTLLRQMYVYKYIHHHRHLFVIVSENRLSLSTSRSLYFDFSSPISISVFRKNYPCQSRKYRND